MTISKKELEFNKNDDAMRLKLSGLRRELDKIMEGGGQKRIEKLHSKGKLTARERIDLLLDPRTDRVEIGALAGYGMYEEHGGCPAGGVVVMIGYVSGKQCIVVANDATVKAGAWFPITGKKNLRAQEIAMENKLPIKYGKSIVCAYARVDGWSVGIVANQREIVKNGKGEMQFGGVIYSDSADKAARFIMNCNQKNIPLVFLQDVSGFMVGSKSEHGGIIKDGAKMVSAMSNSVVPKFTIITGNSYGAGNYAMCGKAYDPRLIVAWPTAELAVMSGASAAKVLMLSSTQRIRVR